MSKLHAIVYIYADLDPDLDTTHGSRYTVTCYDVSVWIYVLNFSNSPITNPSTICTNTFNRYRKTLKIPSYLEIDHID